MIKNGCYDVMFKKITNLRMCNGCQICWQKKIGIASRDLGSFLFLPAQGAAQARPSAGTRTRRNRRAARRCPEREGIGRWGFVATEKETIPNQGSRALLFSVRFGRILKHLCLKRSLSNFTDGRRSFGKCPDMFRRFSPKLAEFQRL